MYFAFPFKPLFGFVASIKIIIVLSFLSSGIFVFLWLNKIFNRLSAIVGALTFIYLPYHLFDLYHRGSVGEIFAFVWVAFCLWMIEEGNPFLLSLGILLLAISHNTVLILFLPVLFVYALVRKSIALKTLTVSFVLGILMASFFLIPAFVELVNTSFLSTKIIDLADSFASLQLAGWLSFAVIIAAFATAIYKKNKNYTVILFITITAICLLLSNEISRPLWPFLPTSVIQFPFRVLSLVLFCVSFLASYLIFSFKKYQYVVAGLVLAFLVISSFKFLLPVKIDNYEDSFYATNEATTTVQDEYMPIWVRVKPSSHSQKSVKIVRGNGEIAHVTDLGSKISFDFNSQTPAVVQIAKIYYPGWRAFSKNSEKAIFYNNPGGLMELKLTSGNQHVNLYFGETPLRLMADAISVFAFGISVLIFVKYRKNLG